MIKGVNLYTIPGDWDNSTMPIWLNRLKAYGITWVFLNPAWFMATKNSTSIAANNPKSPTAQELGDCIDLVHGLGFRVMLKPLIGIDTGDGPNVIGDAFSEPNWTTWFASITDWLTGYAQIAEDHGAEIFCFGSEWVNVQTRETQLRALIAAIRALYSGELSYCSAQDHFRLSECPFWDALDYIATTYYMPLTTVPRFATLAQMASGWIPFIADLNAWATETNKGIIIAEIGASSVEGTNQWPWKSGAEIEALPIDYAEPADYYQSALDAFAGVPALAGIGIWNFQPNDVLGEIGRGFNPFGHPAGEVLRYRWGGQLGGWYNP